MKIHFFLLSFVLLNCATSAQSNEDLMDILKKETESVANLDFEAWKSYWRHTENAYFSYADANGMVSLSGWDVVEKALKEVFESRKKVDLNLRRENVKIERQEQMAFITFDQYNAHANHQAAVERWKTVGDKVTVIDSWR